MQSDRVLNPPTAPENFLQRWSRRKSEARVPAPGAQEDLTPEAQAARAQTAKAAPASMPAAPASEQDQPVLPPLEHLNEDSDYSAFMSANVSDELRRLALRKLFHSPKFNVIDPVDQFVSDWNGFEPLGDVVTHEMHAALEREAEKLRAQAALSSDAALSPDVTPAPDAAAAAAHAPASEAAQTPVPSAPQADSQPAAAVPAAASTRSPTST